ncbi:MAG: InlB B-repeat-containing protein, partial [Bacteroidota bacterium]
MGNVTRSSGTNTSFGGFEGTIRASDVLRCYSIGKVYQSPGIIWTSGGKNQGFIGSYILVEGYTMTFQCNYFDKEASQQTAGMGAYEKTTAEMKTQSTYSSCSGGWGFGPGSENWVMSSPIAYDGYPTFNYTGGYSEAPTSNQIASLSNLVWVAEDATRWSASYTQTANLDAWTTSSWNGNKGWKPIGNASMGFSGNYNGQGNTISNLYINRPTNDSVGLFSRLSGGTISNLGLLNVNFTGDEYVGGLFGYNQSSGVSSSFCTGSVSGANNVGGLAGMNASGTISNCYSLASVSRSSGANISFGGFGGANSGTVQYCYSAGSANFGSAQGFIGLLSGGTCTKNFYDQQASGQSTGAGATAKTTAEMKTQATFTDWNFTPVTGNWSIQSGGYISYPYLREIIYNTSGFCPGINPIPGKVEAPANPTYSLTYNANTGTGNVPVDGSSPYLAGATVTVLGNIGTPSPLSKTNFAFSGWNTQADGMGTPYAVGATFPMPASAVTLYARWLPSSTISFDSQGGTSVAPITQVEGTPVTAPTDPTKAGFTFIGWVPAVPATMPVDDMTCVAQWSAIPTTYPLTYNANGGSGNVPVDASSPYAAAATVTVKGNIGVPPLTRTG